MAGPLFGMTASIFCLIQGLVTTAAMDFHTSSPLPAVPVFLLKSSALGAGLLEFFLGKGVLLSGVTNESVLALDPLAIAGFVGLVVNALSLLPLGSKSRINCLTEMRLATLSPIIAKIPMAGE